jgi:hypothetical protein
VLTDFSSYTKNDKNESFYCRPADQTRVHVAADSENLYLLAMCLGCYDRSTKGNELRIQAAAGIEAQPATLTLDESTAQIASSQPLPRLRCVKCRNEPDAGDSAAVYEIQVPRKPFGIGPSFFLNFCRVVADRLPGKTPKDKALPELSFWRGNECSANDPVVFGRMLICDKK